MNKSGFWLGVLAGALLTVPLIALFFLGDALVGLPLVPFDVFDAVARFPGGRLYGRLLMFGIGRMVDVLTVLNFDVSETAKAAENILAVFGQLITGALIGGLFFVVMRRAQPRQRLWPGLLPGFVVGVPAAIISALVNRTAAIPSFVSFAWIVAVYLAWGAGLLWLFESLAIRARPEVSVEAVSRREFLVRVGAASAAITVVGAGVSALLNTASDRAAVLEEEGADIHRSDPRAQEIAVQARDRIQTKPNLDDSLVPAPGTRPEYTPLDDHYRIDINSRPPTVDGSDWFLLVDGLVEIPLALSLGDLRNNYEPKHQFVTLACVSNPVGGDLTGTTLWTGVSLKAILADVGVRSGATHIEITTVDGFHESVSLDLINRDERIMLTYFWDGEPLRPQHGYPLRIYIPDRFGMKQPKWIKRIEVLERERAGFWVLRGWDNEAFIKTTSVIDTVAAGSASGDPLQIPIGGMALAGARGISKVELRVDQGEWVAAELRSPLSEVSWVIWRYDWPFTPGEHLFEVRCFDGDGRQQSSEDRPPPPSGATGIHNLTTIL